MIKVVKSILCLFCFFGAVLAIPMAFYVKPGFSMSGNYWPLSLFAIFLGFPLTYYFWPWASIISRGGSKRKDKDDEKKPWESEKEFKERMDKKQWKALMRGGVAIVFLIIPYVWGAELIDFSIHENRVEVSEVAFVEKGWSETHEQYTIDFTVDLEIDKFVCILKLKFLMQRL